MSEKAKHVAYLRQLMRDRAHIEIGEQSSHVIDAGLAEVQNARGFSSVEAVVDQVRKDLNSTLTMAVVESMTTNETSFFRDTWAWEALRQQVLPALIRKRSSDRRLSIWSAAGASGQEAYSLVMLLLEHFPDVLNWNLSIVTSDISREMIERTRQGVYTHAEVERGLPPALLKRYFQEGVEGYTISEDVRSIVHPRVLNLADPDLHMPKFDLILARNILIYFDLENKRKLLSQLRNCMHSWTPLILGAGESTVNVHEGFVALDLAGFRCFALRPEETE